MRLVLFTGETNTIVLFKISTIKRPQTVEHCREVRLLAQNTRFWPRANGDAILLNDAVCRHALLPVYILVLE